MTWGGMTACAGLGLGVLLERLVRLRRRKIVPAEFTARFLDRLHEGKLDCGQALDHCELNPSPAAGWRWRRSGAGAGRQPIWSEPSRWRIASRASDCGATWEPCDESPS